MNVNIQLLNTNSKPPTRADPGAAGLDLYVSSTKSLGNGLIEYDTGVAIEIPPGHVGLLFPRSSIRSMGQIFSNSVGVIDSSFRGSIKVTTKRIDDTNYEFYVPGDRCGQLIIIPYPEVTLVPVQKLSETKRGAGAFGSSGR